MTTKLIALSVLAFSSIGAIAEKSPEAETTKLDTLLKATQDNDLKKFESICDENMKKAMTEDNLKKVSVQVSALMKQGYKKVYMGVLDRGAFKTYYWKIDFDKDGAPDMLAELSISKDKVAGFFLR